MTTEWYKLSVEQALSEVGVTTEEGLTSAEAQRRLAQYGPNELQEKPGRSRLEIIWEQFANILTVLLILAAVVSMVLGDWIEAVAILVIVILNGVLGYTQEYRAEQSMAALKKMSVPIVRVRRDGRRRHHAWLPPGPVDPIADLTPRIRLCMLKTTSM